MKWLKRVLIVLAAVFVVGQLIRPDRTNPPVDETKTLYATENVPPNVRAIFDRSCSDCHSNRTVWPWYTNVFPVSWFLADHVKDGRKELNISEWAAYTPKRKARKLLEICEQVQHNDMPLKTYIPMHPAARLTPADRQALCVWAGNLRKK